MRCGRAVWCGVFIFAVCGEVCAQDAPPRFPSPVSAEESLKHFQLDPELKIELVAAEPQVVDPVAIAFAPDGALYVAEMRDYPYGPKDGGKPLSQIVRLTDADGDGRFETSVVFADDLLFCTGVLPYRDGLIVTLAGEIAFLADRNGDGRAEVRETWFAGFAQENSQLRANHPSFGPDGYVYVANGLRGGKIVAVRPEWKKSDEPLVITGFDFRFHPETGEFSTITGHGQFGLTFDDYGNRFVCSNRNPCQHVVLENEYLKRNPQFAAKAVMHDVCAAAEQSQLYPISQAWTTSTLHANQFTAACGVTIFRGDGLPGGYRGNAFTCDPTGNLVHREMLRKDGATFQGKSPYQDREFLASPDTWFRPVNLANGPDGALYIVDMYRAVIEHPDWMPNELKTRPDLLLGNDRGRIYRVVHPSTRRREPRPSNLAALSNGSLAEWTGHPNAWHSQTAARLLVERQASDVAAALREQAFAPRWRTAAVTALWTLHQLGQLTHDDVRRAVNSQTAITPETAIRLAEPYLADDAPLRAQVASYYRKKYADLPFRAALALSAAPLDRDALPLLADALVRHPRDPWLRAAALIAVREQTLELLMQITTALQSDPPPKEPPTELVETLTELSVAHHSAAQLAPLVTAVAELERTPFAADLSWAFVRGWGVGQRRRATSLTAELTALGPAGEQAQSRLAGWLHDATVQAATTTEPSRRLAAIHTLRWAEPAVATPVLLPLVLQPGDTTLALAACDSLSALPGDDCAAPLLEHFPRAVPAVRRAILDVLLAQPVRANLLLDAVDRTVSRSLGSDRDTSALPAIQPAEIDPQRANRLLNHRDPELRARAQKLLAAGSADRAAVLSKYEPALQTLGDAQRGKGVFAKHCVTCHRIAGMGVNVGADIGDTRDKTPMYLLTAILDPNRAVDNNYFGYAVVTHDGKSLTGVIAAETSTSITLKQAEGKTETILRSDIEELRATGQSFMPVGFEKNITPEEMADLVSFLKNWRYLDGAVPVGR